MRLKSRREIGNNTEGVIGKERETRCFFHILYIRIHPLMSINNCNDDGLTMTVQAVKKTACIIISKARKLIIKICKKKMYHIIGKKYI